MHAPVSRPLSDVQMTQMVAIPAALVLPGEGVQHSSHQQRVQDTPHQLIQLPGQQADRKDESWKAKKEKKKNPKGKGKQERGKGMPHRLNNHQSLNKEFKQPVSVTCLAHFGFSSLPHAQTFHDVKFVLACICSVMTELHLAMYSLFY